MAGMIKNARGAAQLLPIFILVILVVAIAASVNLASKKQDVRSKAATGVPSGFVDSRVVSGLNQPTAMAFAPDGRLFVSEKGGSLRVIKNGQLLPTPFLTLNVTSDNERGLLGIDFDPNFATNRFIYAYYTRSTSPIKNRLSRFTASATNPDVVQAGSEQILVDNIASDAGNHNGGAVHFGTDGKLYFSVGDGGSNHQNSQDLSNLSGKIMRINSDGTTPSDNPFVGQTGRRGEIWAYGLRNPFTFAVQPGTGVILLNDVGEGTWEEIDRIVKGGNYGWPTCEGTCSNTNFINPIYQYNHSVGQAITGAVFYDGTQFPSFYQNNYFFGDYVAGFLKRLDTANNNTVTNFADNAAGPVDLRVAPDGSLYYLSINNGSVNSISFGGPTPTPTPSPTPLPPGSQTIDFNNAPGIGGPLNGDYPTGVANWGNTIWMVAGPFAGFSTPSISFNGQGPTSASFTFLSPRRLLSIDATNGGAGSSTITIACAGNATKSQVLGAGQTTTIQTGFTTTCTTITIGSTNGWDTNFDNLIHDGASGPTPTPTPINQPPVPSIDVPAQGTLYNAGDTIGYSGSATDAEDGSPSASAYSWTIVFHHDTHTHPFLGPITGVKSGAFTIPNVGEVSANTWYRIHLTVTDSKGLSTEITRDITPRKVNLTIDSNPTGLQLTLDSQPFTAPQTVQGVVGFLRTLGVMSPQNGFTFNRWSDNGAAQHQITTPATNTTYTAFFTAPAASPTPTPTPTAVPTATPTPSPTPIPQGIVWQGQYYANRYLSGLPLITRNDGDRLSNAGFNWRFGSPASGLPRDRFSVKWSTTTFFTGGNYQFAIRHDDGMRVSIDDQIIFNMWRDGSVRTDTAQVTIPSGNHIVTVLFYENRGRAEAKVSWQTIP